MDNESTKGKTFKNNVLICTIWSIVGCAIIMSIYLWSQWLLVTANGSYLNFGLFCLMGMVALGAILLILGGLLLLISNKTRCAGVCILISCVLYLLTCYASLRIGHKVYMYGFVRLAERSKPLIESIIKYEKDHRCPPDTLDNLVPDYLDKIPSTGMGESSEYEYKKLSKDTIKDMYWNNEWQVTVEPPFQGLGWDNFIYVPKQNYPDHSYLERIGDWVYWHE